MKVFILFLCVLFIPVISNAGPLLDSAIRNTQGITLEVTQEKVIKTQNYSWVAAQWFFIGSAVADMGTTHYGLNKGLSESNPLAPGNIVGMYIIKGLATSAVLFSSRIVYPLSPRLAEGIVWVAGSGWTMTAINNARLARGI